MTIPFIILLCAIAIIFVIIIIIIIAYFNKLSTANADELNSLKPTIDGEPVSHTEKSEQILQEIQDIQDKYTTCKYKDLDGEEYEVQYLKADGKPDICKEKECKGYLNNETVNIPYYGSTQPAPCRKRLCIGVNNNKFQTYEYIGDNKPKECDFIGCHTLDDNYNYKSVLYPEGDEKPKECDIKECKVVSEYGNWIQSGEVSYYVDKKPPECRYSKCDGALGLTYTYRASLPKHPACNLPVQCLIMLDSNPRWVLSAFDIENGGRVELINRSMNYRYKKNGINGVSAYLWRIHRNGAIEYGNRGYYINIEGSDDTELYDERWVQLWDSTNYKNARWSLSYAGDDTSIGYIVPRYRNKIWALSQWGPDYKDWVCMKRRNDSSADNVFRFVYFINGRPIRSLT